MKPSRVEFHRESIAQPTPCRARHYVHGKLNPLPNSQEWLNQIYAESLVPFTLELQTMPQACLSWYPTVLGFPFHSQRTWARTHQTMVLTKPWSVHLKVSPWLTYTNHTMYCVDGHDQLYGVCKSVLGGWNRAWEICGILNMHSIYATLFGSSRPHVSLWPPLYSLYYPVWVYYSLHFYVVWTNIPVWTMSSTQSQDN